MYSSTNIIHTSKAERTLAKIYLFCLPFRMFALFSFLPMLVGPLANFFDSIINIIGLFVWYRNEGSLKFHSRNSHLFKTIAFAILYLNLSSLLMAIVMYSIYGDHNGASPFYAIIPMQLFYFQYLLIFLYNIRVFAIMDYTTIRNVLKLLCRILLLIGYMQVLVMNGIGGSAYDMIVSIIGGIKLSDQLPKLCLTLSEGAAAGCLMGTLVFPFLFARYNEGDKKTLYEILLWLPVLFYTHSSTATILFVIVFLIFLTRSRKKNLSSMISMGIVAAIIVITALFISNSTSSSEDDTLQYLLFEKAIDQENTSTASRSVNLYVNWGAFTEMPIMGVGNGLQGYFFIKYFPMELLYVQGSNVEEYYYNALTRPSIANGATFFPGFLSGYGVFGLIVLIVVISNIVKTYERRKENLGLFGDMFVMSGFAFLFMGLQGDAYCLYYAWFGITIPFMWWSTKTLQLNGR